MFQPLAPFQFFRSEELEKPLVFPFQLIVIRYWLFGKAPAGKGIALLTNNPLTNNSLANPEGFARGSSV